MADTLINFDFQKVQLFSLNLILRDLHELIYSV